MSKSYKYVLFTSSLFIVTKTKVIKDFCFVRKWCNKIVHMAHRVFCHVCCELIAKNMSYITTSCWGIWTTRNTLLFNSKNSPPQEAAMYAFQVLRDYHAMNSPSRVPSQTPNLQSWQPPIFGRIKINTDAGIRPSERWGISDVFRSAPGKNPFSGGKRNQWIPLSRNRRSPWGLLGTLDSQVPWPSRSESWIRLSEFCASVSQSSRHHSFGYAGLGHSGLNDFFHILFLHSCG